LSLLGILFSLLLGHSSNSFVVGVQGVLDGSLSETVSLAFVVGSVGSGGSDDRLDFVGVDDLGNIGVGEDGSVESVSVLLLRAESVCSEDLVQGAESGLGPDDESAEVTTGSELLEVKSGDVADVDSGDVSDSLDELSILIAVDEERSLLQLESLGSELADTRSGGLAFNDSLDIFPSTDSLEESDGILGLFDGFELVFNDAGDVGDGGESVSSGHNEGDVSGGSQSRGNSVSLLLEVDLSVPSSPGLEGSEHSSLSAHVTEGTLSGSVGTGASDSGNTSNGSTSSPGFGRMLHAGLGGDSVGLSDVLGDLIVNELDDIDSDGDREN